MIKVLLALIFLLSHLTPASSLKHEVIQKNNINGVDSVIYVPSGYNSEIPNKFIIFFHGAGGGAYDLLQNDPLHNSMLKAFLKSGYILIGSDYSTIQNWGNESSLSETKQMLVYYRSKFNLEDNPYVYMSSMGGSTALNAIAHGIINPKAVVAVSPVTNLNDMYIGQFQSSLNLAYHSQDVTEFNKASVGYNPVDDDPVVFLKIPMLIWDSDSDTVVNKKQNTDLLKERVNKIGGNVNVVETSGEHGDISNFDPEKALEFFETN
jgi:acetyl esterase/lipase